MGRMRGLAARLNRRLCHADVAWRLQAGARCRARAKARRCVRHCTDRRRRSNSNAWTCFRRRILFPVSRSPCGICSVKSSRHPVYSLLGYSHAYPKLPYASQLFGDAPEDTLAGCRAARERGFRAVKCGWGPFGRGSLAEDRDQLQAAREGLGRDGTLLDRCRSDLARGCRCRGRAHRHARGGRRHLAGGTIPRRCLRRLFGARRA